MFVKKEKDMEVYIEYVLLDNLVINWLIMHLSLVITKNKLNKKRVLLADFVGTLCAIIMPLIVMPTIVLFVSKMVLGLLLVWIMAKYRNPLSMMITYMIFLTVTFVFGGVCYGVLSMLGMPTTLGGVLINGYNIPMSGILLLVLGYAWLMKKLIAYLQRRQPIEQLYYDLVLYHNGQKVMCKGFLDTGNRLVSKERHSLMVVGMTTFQKLYPNINYIQLCKTEKLTENGYYLDVGSIGSTSKVWVTTIEKMEIYTEDKMWTIHGKEIGIAMTNFAEFDCILSYSDVMAFGEV